MKERITGLELRFMHQERTIQELNDAVYRQERIIERLERDVALLREQLSLLAPSAVAAPDDEGAPPHY